jgi:hypothetical protein
MGVIFGVDLMFWVSTLISFHHLAHILNHNYVRGWFISVVMNFMSKMFPQELNDWSCLAFGLAYLIYLMYYSWVLGIYVHS